MCIPNVYRIANMYAFAYTLDLLLLYHKEQKKRNRTHLFFDVFFSRFQVFIISIGTTHSA